jgi:hypothetical protein
MLAPKAHKCQWLQRFRVGVCQRDNSEARVHRNIEKLTDAYFAEKGGEKGALLKTVKEVTAEAKAISPDPKDKA